MNLVKRYFTPLQNCSYSSNFNSPIESTWGIAKRRFQKKMLLRKSRIDQAVLRKLVQESLEEIRSVTQANLLNANRSYITQYLKLC